MVFSPLPRMTLICQDITDFHAFLHGRAGMEEDQIDEAITRAGGGKARTLFEFWLADQINLWVDQHIWVLMSFIVQRIVSCAILLLVIPGEFLTFMWIFLVCLAFQWVMVLGFFLVGLSNIFLLGSIIVWPVTLVLGQFIIGPTSVSPSVARRLP